MTFTKNFLKDTQEILSVLDVESIEKIVSVIAQVKENQGRVFFAGSGGGAGHASHATCDFRKLLGIESYSITDNVSEITARVNDEGWEHAYSEWLKVSKISKKDCLFILSVGGGNRNSNVSLNLCSAIDLAISQDSFVVGIVGFEGGYTLENSDACLQIPKLNSRLITAQTEGLQSVIWHLIVNHPGLNPSVPKWESLLL